ncbi:hypothetical protein Micbo1qcDRAFT_55458 [Microdochium bolleyi]|uniref:Uncharacterized protein n=1 Tax=Microdochium bolleyi TaxID=196109 RepID=A0A136J8J2_9PEZI|nr:hypothetical protein Micbo1qcDRAFT_55458 [Microdochium bolleyi]
MRNTKLCAAVTLTVTLTAAAIFPSRHRSPSQFESQPFVLASKQHVSASRWFYPEGLDNTRCGSKECMLLQATVVEEGTRKMVNNGQMSSAGNIAKSCGVHQGERLAEVRRRVSLFRLRLKRVANRQSVA